MLYWGAGEGVRLFTVGALFISVASQAHVCDLFYTLTFCFRLLKYLDLTYRLQLAVHLIIGPATTSRSDLFCAIHVHILMQRQALQHTDFYINLLCTQEGSGSCSWITVQLQTTCRKYTCMFGRVSAWTRNTNNVYPRAHSYTQKGTSAYPELYIAAPSEGSCSWLRVSLTNTCT